MFGYTIKQFTKKDAFGRTYSGIGLTCNKTRAWTLINKQEANDLLELAASGDIATADENAQDILIADRALVLDLDGVWKSDEDAKDDAQERFDWAEHYRIERDNVRA